MVVVCLGQVRVIAGSAVSGCTCGDENFSDLVSSTGTVLFIISVKAKMCRG